VNAEQQGAVMRYGSAVIYTVPEGATVKLLTGWPGYLCVCTHPDRPAWYVTHDGREVEIPVA